MNTSYQDKVDLISHMCVVLPPVPQKDIPNLLMCMGKGGEVYLL